MNNSLLSKLLTGTSGILNTANKIIPLYEEIKPLLKSCISIKNKIKNLNLKNIFNYSYVQKNNENKKENQKIYSSNPQFFL